jgi:hypothetical protein
MSLIQVPKTKEEIAEYLGDGMDTSVPAVQMSDVNDGDLLNATRTVEVGNGYRFEITLPSGRVLESAPVGSDYPKRDAIMQWLGAVRESIVEDAANAARATRDAHLAESRARDLAQPSDHAVSRPRNAGVLERPTAQPEPAIADPVEYAKQQLRIAVERLAQLATAEQEVAKWQRVVRSLTGEDAPKKRRKKRKQKAVIV